MYAFRLNAVDIQGALAEMSALFAWLQFYDFVDVTVQELAPERRDNPSLSFFAFTL